MSLKLSEAIRLGAMLKPQGYQLYQRNGASCALGAAMDALGIQAEEQMSSAFTEFATLRLCTHEVAEFPPGCSDECRWSHPFRMGDLIVHLNDDHRWTREQIADWVETIEQREAEKAQPETVTA